MIREVAVQGPRAVPEVSAAIAELDADPSVEVIVVARGGGSVEDLLPFSNEAMVRAAAACRTPLVSAIGHETDAPLLDLVADHRASTPTDAAKRIVPDVAEERLRTSQARARTAAAIDRLLRRETERLAQLRSRPVLAAPDTLLDRHAEDVARLRDAIRRGLDAALGAGPPRSTGWSPRWRRSRPPRRWPAGYAVVQRDDGAVLRRPADACPATPARAARRGRARRRRRRSRGGTADPGQTRRTRDDAPARPRP